MCVFTIAIPAYKTLYLEQSIRSVLAQTYDDFELIILNDGSPFDVSSIVNSFQDKRIRYYENPKNNGAIRLVDTWNQCLNHAKGEYIICMGDDDILLPHCLSDYNSLITKHPKAPIFHGQTDIIDEKGFKTETVFLDKSWESVWEMIINRWCGRSQYIGDFLFEIKQLKANNGFYNLPCAWCSDDISVFRAAAKYGCYNTSRSVFEYRVHSSTISVQQNNNRYKYIALYEARSWFINFLNHTAPQTLEDKLLKEQIREKLTPRFGGQLDKHLYNDILFHPIRNGLFWIRHRDQFQIPLIKIRSIYFRIFSSMRHGFEKQYIE